MHNKQTMAAVHPGEREMTDTTSAHIVTIVSLGPDGTPEVQLRDGAVMPARMTFRVARERLETAIAQRHQTVVLFENGDRSRPLIVGFIEAAQPQVITLAELSQIPQLPCIEADVDGRRVRLTAADEIVLQCGHASITLRRNGRVIIRGTDVESRSAGTNRIRGGQVQIN